MRRSLASSVVVLSFLMVTTFAVLLGTSLATRAQRVESISRSRICSMNISAYVKEIAPNGDEVALDFNRYPQLDKSLWGIYDKRRSDSQPIAFNQGSLALYQVFSTDRSFVAFPEDNEIYNAGEKSFVTLAYDSARFELARKEIKVCQRGNSNQWLCADKNAPETAESEQSLDKIENLHMDCDMKLEFGWIVRPIEQAFVDPQENNIQSEPAKPINKAADVNNDFAYNTLDLLAIINSYSEQGINIKADVNNDEIVNALDYTIVVAAIESQ